MLGSSFPIESIPGVKRIFDQLDAQKADFLAIPSNVRMALDRLARVRAVVAQKGPITVKFSDAANTVQNNLQSLQAQWDAAAGQFGTLDSMRSGGGLSLNASTVALATSLLASVTYVKTHAKANVQAVDNLARDYMTADERAKLNMATYGTTDTGGATKYVLLAGLAYWFAFRGGPRRRR